MGVRVVESGEKQVRERHGSCELSQSAPVWPCRDHLQELQSHMTLIFLTGQQNYLLIFLGLVGQKRSLFVVISANCPCRAPPGSGTSPTLL